MPETVTKAYDFSVAAKVIERGQAKGVSHLSQRLLMQQGGMGKAAIKALCWEFTGRAENSCWHA